MQRIRTGMTSPTNPAAFEPTTQTEFQYHYPHNSAVGYGPGCKETYSGTAQMRFDETIVHIVRNDPAVTKSLTDFFVSKRVNVATFKTGAEYMEAPRDARPTCLILDLELPDLNGLDIQSRLADKGAPPVVFVTSHGDSVSMVRAMKNGAIDFMLEPVDYGRLMSAVELAFSEDLKNRNVRIELASLLARWWSLTQREAEVFHYTVAGLLNKQAAAALGVAENTYQVHRGRVMRKMKANSLADLVRMSTKLEPILPKPCRTRVCYGTAVMVPMRTEEPGPPLTIECSDSKRKGKGVTMRTH
jgi:FixJ family two-component response regulator